MTTYLNLNQLKDLSEWISLNALSLESLRCIYANKLIPITIYKHKLFRKINTYETKDYN